MRVRGIQSKDLEKLRSLHQELGFDYKFPEPDEFFESEVIVDDNDNMVMWMGAKRLAELFMYMDPKWGTPSERLEIFRVMHEHMEALIGANGVYEGNTWLPPQVEKSFGRRLIRDFGWVRSTWACFSKRIKRS